jgi:hypothetical protein
VNFDDYVIIDINFNEQNGTLRRAVDWISGDDRTESGRAATGMEAVVDHFEQFGVAYGHAFHAAVPEPAAPLTALLLCAARTRRRRGES